MPDNNGIEYTGAWTGAGITADATDPKDATVTNLAAGENVLTWTVTPSGDDAITCPDNSAVVTITNMYPGEAHITGDVEKEGTVCVAPDGTVT